MEESLKPAPKNIFQHRVTILFATTLAAFSFTTWLLTRTQINSNETHDASTPEGVIRMQLNALAQGEPQIAYAQFSPQYREEVPYAAFQQIATTHNQMFRANKIAIEAIAMNSQREELRVRITSADGQHYIARYVTILIEGRWWIDAMRWRPDESPPERIFSRAMGARQVGGRVHHAPGLALGVSPQLDFSLGFLRTAQAHLTVAYEAA
jgi:Domain of unknown function (DUF4864)